MNSLEERFKSLKEHEDIFGFLYNMQVMKNMDISELEKNCDDLYLKLKDGEDADVSAIHLKTELMNLRTILPDETNHAQDVLNYITELNLDCVFPNVMIALRILLTLPVAVAAAERSFSKLKILKNYLRTTTNQERLTSLAIISIEKSISQTINYKEAIKEFAAIKARRMI